MNKIASDHLAREAVVYIHSQHRTSYGTTTGATVVRIALRIGLAVWVGTSS